MTHKKIFRVLALAAFVAMFVIAPLQAAPGCQKQGDQKTMMSKGCMMGPGCMMLKNIPNLTDEQKAKLEKLQAEHQKLMAKAMGDMEKLAGEMVALLKDPVDVKMAEAKIDEMAMLKAGMQKKCLAHRLAVRALLTDEQKAKLGDMGCGMMAGGMMMGGHACGMGQGHMAGKSGKCCNMKQKMKMAPGQCLKKVEEKKEEKK
jgi:Spy/CpxP family protein refolding chaperone